jgi:hypothetical protein
MGPNERTRDEVADKRRHAKPVGNGTEDKGQHETGDDRRDQRRVVRHDGTVLG